MTPVTLQSHRHLADMLYRAAGVTRDYTNRPYIEYCQEVIDFITNTTGDPHLATMLSPTVYFHCVLEDTSIVVNDLVLWLDDTTITRILALTDVTVETVGGPRSYRKEIDRHRLADACAETQLIKLGAIYSNLTSIMAHDRAFGSVFLDEVQLLLPRLTKAQTTYPDAYDMVSQSVFVSQLHLQRQRYHKDAAWVEGDQLPTVANAEQPVRDALTFLDGALVDTALRCKRVKDKLYRYGITGNIFDKQEGPYLHDPSFFVGRLIDIITTFHFPPEHHYALNPPQISDVSVDETGRYVVTWRSVTKSGVRTHRVRVPVFDAPRWIKTPVAHWSFIDPDVTDVMYTDFTDAGATIVELFQYKQGMRQ